MPTRRSLAVALTTTVLTLGLTTPVSAVTVDEGCVPTITSATVSPAQTPVGISAVRYATFRVGVLDPCNLVGSLSAQASRTSVGAAFTSPLTLEYDGYPAQDGRHYASAAVPFDPATLRNALAGTWGWSAVARSWQDADDRTTVLAERRGPDFFLQRWSTLVVNAAPEPVKKGGKITVTGTLQRASWDARAYGGYGSQPVVLQERTLTGTYTSLKTVTTNSSGIATASVTATSDKCYRYVFAGTTTTPAVTATGDCVDVT